MNTYQNHCEFNYKGHCAGIMCGDHQYSPECNVVCDYDICPKSFQSKE